jgi:hypothetical protein
MLRCNRYRASVLVKRHCAYESGIDRHGSAYDTYFSVFLVMMMYLNNLPDLVILI